MSSTRLFLAIAIEDEARRSVAREVEGLNADVPLPGKLHRPENWHLTLVFLGQLTAERRESLIQTMDRAALGAAFAIEIAGLGAFPALDAATTLWLGVVAGNRRLADLQAVVETAAVLAGHHADPRLFTPHLTLSRLSKAVDVRAWSQKAMASGIKCPVQRVTLYESRSGVDGIQYIPQRSWPLSVTMV